MQAAASCTLLRNLRNNRMPSVRLLSLIFGLTTNGNFISFNGSWTRLILFIIFYLLILGEFLGLLIGYHPFFRCLRQLKLAISWDIIATLANCMLFSCFMGRLWKIIIKVVRVDRHEMILFSVLILLLFAKHSIYKDTIAWETLAQLC